jgi:hypothetical protein
MTVRGETDPFLLRKKLARDLNPDIAALPARTIRAVFEDWDRASVERLRRLLIDHDARIVISSSWREVESIQTLRTIFSIHGLDIFLAGCTPILTHRVAEVGDFLQKNAPIERFVIFDDETFYGLQTYYPENFVLCPDEIGEAEWARADAILKS